MPNDSTTDQLAPADGDRSKTVRQNCTKFVTHHPVKNMAEWFDLLSQYLKENAIDSKPDSYGDGEYINQFEKEIADLLGKEAAVFMPSGTMAQQIALRIWADTTGSKKVALHPTAHLEIAEHYGYIYLHHLQRIQWGISDFTANRLLTAKDFDRLKEVPGSVLLELPQRPIGAQLPQWDDLMQIGKWCDDRGVKLHLDGARIWEAAPFYQKSLAEICAIFDSVYVSFYKGLDGITGSVLAGPQAFIDEAKIWQRRMGGNLRSMFPYVVSAKMGLDKHLPLMKSYYEKAKQLAEELNKMEPVGIFQTNPTIPHTNTFQLFIRGNADAIKETHLDIAEQSKMWLINGTRSSGIPSYQQTEMVIGSNFLQLDMDEVIRNFKNIAERLS